MSGRTESPSNDVSTLTASAESSAGVTSSLWPKSPRLLRQRVLVAGDHEPVDRDDRRALDAPVSGQAPGWVRTIAPASASLRMTTGESWFPETATVG